MLKHKYWVCKSANEEVYLKMLDKLKNVSDFAFKYDLHDVDDSRIAIFEFVNTDVRLHNCQQINEVYIESELDIEELITVKT